MTVLAFVPNVGVPATLDPEWTLGKGKNESALPDPPPLSHVIPVPDPHEDC